MDALTCAGAFMTAILYPYWNDPPNTDMHTEISRTAVIEDFACEYVVFYFYFIDFFRS